MSFLARRITSRSLLSTQPLRLYTTSSSTPLAAPSPNYTQGERTIHEKLANQLQATKLLVSDVSGGCGSMYSIQIASPLFKGQSLVKQHRMVTELLSEDIKGMHGIQIKTEAV
ncbi:hypothetical protein SpCBS45565_g02312 [Spizellomyces sp. 'palustris']|nr:hypothetical protein SpCBS45565_g02312 [Spizellomyces sp. 'palustris']